MSEYPYLEKAIKHYDDRFKKRPPIRDEVAEYNELKMSLDKVKAFDGIVSRLKYYDSEAIDSLNVNYHDFGINAAEIIDGLKEESE